MLSFSYFKLFIKSKFLITTFESIIPVSKCSYLLLKLSITEEAEGAAFIPAERDDDVLWSHDFTETVWLQVFIYTGREGSCESLL